MTTSVWSGLIRRFQVNFGLKGTRREHVGLLFSGGGRCMINELSLRLLALHAGGIEKDFTPWVTDAVLARVLREGVVLRPDPRNVLYQIGAPLQCHANALNFELMGVKLVRGVVPWFGFRLMDRCWWCHSFVVSGGLVIDSGAPSLSSLYFAMPWDAGLFRML